MHVSRKEPGLIVSAAAHATLLAATLLAFGHPAKFEDAQEAIPVEMITDQAFSQISKGEKTAKEVKPVQKADKVADIHELKPTPPMAEAKKDVPLPPSPLKRLRDPGEDEEQQKPEPQKTAALPPPRPPMEETKPAPEPPKRPEPPKAQAKEETKPEPDKAEAVAPKPPERPKTEAKSEPKPAPTPPKPPEKPRLKTDEVAKLLSKSRSEEKAEKPASRPKSGQESDEKNSKFDTNAISRLLDHDKPQAKGSTGKEIVRTASLGTASGTAQRMAPNLVDALNSLMMEQYMRCWHYFGTGAIHKYVPQVRVHFRQDGSLIGEPTLVNPTSEPEFASLASAAINAARECNPMKIPAQFAPYYDQWKSRTIAFDPEEMR